MSYKKTEKITGIREIISSNGNCLIPMDKLLKCPSDEQGFKNFYRKTFNPAKWASEDLDNMSVEELRDLLAQKRENRRLMGLPPADIEKTIDECWRKHKK